MGKEEDLATAAAAAGRQRARRRSGVRHDVGGLFARWPPR